MSEPIELDGCRVYLCNEHLVITGAPNSLPDEPDENHRHNCDAQGCGYEHVLWRARIDASDWPDKQVKELLSLLDELLCREETHEATALVQSVLCGTASWSHIRERLSELQLGDRKP